MPFVLDSSIAAVWCLRDERSSLAERALDAAGAAPALVPALFWFEVRNLVVQNERRGRLSEADGAAFLALLDQLGLEVDTLPSSAGVLSLAREHRLTAYDATYLELARRRGLSLATLDRPLAEAARAVGVPPFAG